MREEDKFIKMYEDVHGKITSKSCKLVARQNDMGEVDGVVCMKDGVEAWSVSKVDLLFDYITKDW